MPAPHLQVQVRNGVQRFFCPACGEAIFDEEEGFRENSCRHVRFFFDWVGELWFTDPKRLADEKRKNQKSLIKIWEDSNDEWDDAFPKLRDELPDSAAVFSLVEPARGGGHDGSHAVVCCDFDE